ncbi:lipocalin family protein [Flavobacterium sp.]|uniref:lipocalin family protein n=1 Tax=Flavobacterium sp. TaxID=239 RepID=UPI0040334F2F
MKKFTFLAFAAIMAISCSDHDNSNTPASLDGTWRLTYVNLNREPEDLNGDGTASENYLDESDCLQNSTIVFESDENAVFSSNCMSETPNTPETTEYEGAGSTVTFTYYAISQPGGYKDAIYIRSGNTLTAILEETEGGTYPYIPGDGENGDTDSFFRGATFTYTKQ